MTEPFDPREHPDAVAMPIDGCLDLHAFTPRDVKELVPAYLAECLARGILDVRIVHGKGSGTLRRIVHGILDRHPSVVWYGQRADAGSWGATVVALRRDAVTDGQAVEEQPGGTEETES
jgi:DNA-nicking Smr family endonuclease